MKPGDTSLAGIAIDWGALADAFEGSAGGARAYLHRLTGTILRLAEGEEDPRLVARIAVDAAYVRIDPVSVRVQYGWMERYIRTVPDPDLKERLTQAILGKGAFRRFREVLAEDAAAHERWLAFRERLLQTALGTWLRANDLQAAPRARATPRGASLDASPHESAAALRERLCQTADALGPRDLHALTAFARFMTERAREPAM